MATIKINVFRDAGTWYGARWIDGEYDGCDSLDVSSERDALEAARCLPLACAGERIVVLVQSSNAAPELVDALRAVLQHCVTAAGFLDKGKGRTDAQQTAYEQARALLTRIDGK